MLEIESFTSHVVTLLIYMERRLMMNWRGFGKKRLWFVLSFALKE